MTSTFYDYKVQVALGISSFPDTPSDIVKLIGLKPHRVAAKGERNPDKVIPRQNLVSYRSKASNWDSELEEHWENFKKSSVVRKLS